MPPIIYEIYDQTGRRRGISYVNQFPTIEEAEVAIAAIKKFKQHPYTEGITELKVYKVERVIVENKYEIYEPERV